MVNYIILALSWIVYGVLHSALATTRVKMFFEKNATNFYRYYRFAYSIFAVVTLVPVLLFQYSFKSIVVIHTRTVGYFALVLLVLPGFIVMIISIWKYFKLLSGIRSLFQPRPPAELKLNGIHKYVRHPLYLGTILFTWGLFFLFPLLNNLIAVVIITIYVLVGISFEEKKLLKEFGNVYATYMHRVPALIPDFRNNRK